MREKILEELVRLAEREVAIVNQRNRMLLSSIGLEQYIIMSELRLPGMNGFETTKVVYAALKCNPQHYEYEVGQLHLYHN